MIIEVHTACRLKDGARLIAKRAVAELLYACVHLAQTESCYRWNDAVHDALEYRLSFKTTQERYLSTR